MHKYDGFRTLVVVEDPVEIERIRQIVGQTEDFTLLGHWAHGEDPTTLIRETAPELLILSVELGQLNGFDVLEALNGTVRPLTILVSRDNKNAVSAFRYHPLDFLLLPVDEAHLAETMRRARAVLTERNSQGTTYNVLEMLSRKKGGSPPHQRIMVKSGGRIVFVRQEEIDWIDAERDYVCIHNGTRKYLIRERISHMERQLPSERFLRIHRSTIVNVERIRELHPLSYGEYAVVLHDGTRLTLSRSYRGKVFDRLTTAA